MADDEDVIYIDVVPKVDDAAADSAVGKLKDKFKDVAGDIGPEFMDALSNSGALEQLGTKLGSVLANPLKDLSSSIGLDLENPLEKLLKKDMTGALGDIGTQIGKNLASAIGDPLKGVADTLGVDLESALGNALNKDWGGLGADLGKGIGGKIASGLGLDDALGDLGGLDSVLDKVHGVADAVRGARSGDLSGGLHGVSGLLGADDQATPVHDFLKQSGLDDFISKIPIVGTVEQDVEKLQQKTYQSIPTSNPDPNVNPHGWWGTMFGVGSNLMPWVHDKPPAPPPPSHADALYEGVFGEPYGAGGGGGGGGGKTTANEVEVQSSVATVSAGSVTLGGNISLPSISLPSSGSGGGHSAPSIGTAGSGGGSGGGGGIPTSSGGGNTLGKAGSFAQGGMLPGDSPGYDNILSSVGGHPIGLEGGEFIVNPKAAQANKDLLKAINSGSHFDEGGQLPFQGDPNNLSISMPPTQGNQPPQQEQQLGHGQGAGVTGGGAIGMAEQAAVMAAAVGGFGGGGIAAQAAMQEMNLAVQKGGQIAATLVAAPFETLGLTGGQMGAPQVNPMGGWPGKLIGGLIGQQTNLPNIAGKVQPPKQPDQKQQQGEDPGNGGQQGGPAGTKDDPMHVNVQNQPQPGQGSATTQSNFNALAGITPP